MPAEVGQALSIIKVIWFIAAGVLIFFLIFLFVKRQIMRFTFKPSYTAIGHNAPKKLQMEIQRRLERVSYIKGEPKLLTGKIEEIARTTENHYYYRMKAVDAFSQFGFNAIFQHKIGYTRRPVSMVEEEPWETPRKDLPTHEKLLASFLTYPHWLNLRLEPTHTEHKIGYTWQPVLMVDEEPWETPPERTIDPREAASKLSHIPTLAESETQTHVDRDEVLKSENVNNRGRHPSQTVRNYLLTLYPQYLQTAPADLIHHFADAYEHARHGPKVFGKQQYNKYMEMLEELISYLKVGLQENKQCEDSVTFNTISLLETEVTFNPYSKSSKTKTSIPYNHMVSNERMQTGFRNQSRYRTRASSTEQEGLLESNQSSQRSSIAELDASMECSVDQKLLTLGDEEKV